MELLSLPSEVISDQILPYLSYNDLLRFRRVSHLAQDFADDFIRLFKHSNRFVKLSTGSTQNLTEFLKVAPLSLSKFQIAISNPKVFGSAAIEELLQLYGEEITHLQLNHLEIPIVSRRIQRFFESLTNLRSLSIAEVVDRDFRRKGCPGQRSRPPPLPQSLRKLNKLRIENYMCSDDAASKQLVWEFINECSPELEFLQHPTMEYHLTGNDNNPFSQAIQIIVGNNLKTYDLNGFNESDVALSFSELVDACGKNSVKLLNVHTELIDQMISFQGPHMGNHESKLAAVVYSVVGMSLSTVQLNLPHLEAISIQSTVACSLPHWKFDQPKWPSLSHLDLLIDSEYLTIPEDAPRDLKTNELLRFFFVGVKREKLEKLKIRFSPYYAYRYPDDILPCPKIVDFCSSCPNITCLTLSAWIGTNRAISKIWGGLRHLEEVTFDGCTRIGDKAFIGKLKGAPCVFQAKNLKILRLERVADMPKITNALFTSALRNMPLKQLHIGTGHIKTVTIDALESLSQGVFGQTIEKFPLNCISLPNTTPEQINLLRKQFRCENML